MGHAQLESVRVVTVGPPQLSLPMLIEHFTTVSEIFKGSEVKSQLEIYLFFEIIITIIFPLR